MAKNPGLLRDGRDASLILATPGLPGTPGQIGCKERHVGRALLSVRRPNGLLKAGASASISVSWEFLSPAAMNPVRQRGVMPTSSGVVHGVAESSFAFCASDDVQILPDEEVCYCDREVQARAEANGPGLGAPT